MAKLDELARQAAIHRTVDAMGRVSVQALANRFDVSLVTVRKDLTVLEGRGALRRVRGGALRQAEPTEGSFAARLRERAAAKRAVAAAAAAYVRDGDTISLDSSSTCYLLAAELVGRRDLIVVTNGLPAALLLLDQSPATVFLTGGVLRAESRAAQSAGVVGPGFVGTVAKGFFSAASVGADAGAIEVSLEEATSKQAIAAACQSTYLLFDSSKFGGVGFHPWLPPDRVGRLITDEDATAEQLRPWRARDVPVDQVTVGACGNIVRSS